jgi:hypothetical protein
MKRERVRQTALADLGNRTMKPLDELPAFPAPVRQTLRQQFGIGSAEAFFEHATRNAQGVRTALGLSVAKLDELLQRVEGYLTPAFVHRGRQPPPKRPRGLHHVVPGDFLKVSIYFSVGGTTRRSRIGSPAPRITCSKCTSSCARFSVQTRFTGSAHTASLADFW